MATPARMITAAERRARLPRRHRLASGCRGATSSTQPGAWSASTRPIRATVYLSAWARVEGMTVADLERALYVDRSLVKQLAMRRTLFVFPREALGLPEPPPAIGLPRPSGAG